MYAPQAAPVVKRMLDGKVRTPVLVNGFLCQTVYDVHAGALYHLDDSIPENKALERSCRALLNGYKFKDRLRALASTS